MATCPPAVLQHDRQYGFQPLVNAGEVDHDSLACALCAYLPCPMRQIICGAKNDQFKAAPLSLQSGWLVVHISSSYRESRRESLLGMRLNWLRLREAGLPLHDRGARIKNGAIARSRFPVRGLFIEARKQACHYHHIGCRYAWPDGPALWIAYLEHHAAAHHGARHCDNPLTSASNTALQRALVLRSSCMTTHTPNFTETISPNTRTSTGSRSPTLTSHVPMPKPARIAACLQHSCQF